MYVICPKKMKQNGYDNILVNSFLNYYFLAYS